MTPYALMLLEVLEIGTLGNVPPRAKCHQDAKASGSSTVGKLESLFEGFTGMGLQRTRVQHAILEYTRPPSGQDIAVMQQMQQEVCR